jgi:hypothetical protein
MRICAVLEENVTPQSSMPSPEATPRGLAWWKFILLVIGIGPLPFFALAVLDDKNVLPQGTLTPVTVIAFFGALWGLVAGLLRGALLRMLIGVNVGALIGIGVGSYLLSAAKNNHAQNTNMEFLFLHGPALGLILASVCAEKSDDGWLISAMKWILVGMLVIVAFLAPSAIMQTIENGRFSNQFKLSNKWIIPTLIMSPSAAAAVLVYFVRLSVRETPPSNK